MASDNELSFCLIERPWILAQRLDGQVDLMSLQETLARAHELRGVVGDVPTQTFAIVRLLLALLHCGVDGPKGEDEWGQLWASPKLPVDDVLAYVGEFRDRFDLMHPRTPFYQVADLRTSNNDVPGLEKLIADMPNGEPFFTTRLGQGLNRISLAEAARWVVHCHAFDPSGIKSGAVGDDRVKGGKGYPIGTGFAGALGGVFAEGDTLRETLLLNLVPEDVTGYLRRDDVRDRPVWERAPQGPAEEAASEHGPYGVLGLYTWQSRRIRLLGDADGITGALIANGDKLAAHNLNLLEPMTAWRRSAPKEKALKLPTVYMPRTHHPARALWRGLEAMLPGTTAGRHAREAAAVLHPGVMQWTAQAVNRGYLDPAFRVRARAIGISYGTKESVVDEIIDDSVTMTARLLADDNAALRTTVVDAVSDAEAGTKAVAILAGDLAKASGGRGDAADDAAKQASQAAYAHLDQLFRQWLAQLDPNADGEPTRVTWQRTAKEALRRYGSQLIAQAGPSAWAGRVIDKQHVSSPQAELWFQRNLNRAFPLANLPVEQDSPASEPMASEPLNIKEVVSS